MESAHKSEEAVETSAYLVREGYRSPKLKPYRKAAPVSYTHLDVYKRQPILEDIFEQSDIENLRCFYKIGFYCAES